MSEIQVGQINSTDGSTAITTGADGYVSFAKTQIGGRRNLIINGAMQVAQRGTSAAISSGKDYSSLDRFFEDNTLLDEYVGTISQVSDAPSGFSSSLKITTTTAESSIASDEYFYVAQAIEAQNLQHLKYGQSDANQLTLSFWAKSSVTGTYGVNCYSPDGSRLFTSTYSINTADTWEYKTIAIVGDVSGTINNDAGTGLQIGWHLAAGSNFTSTDRTSWGAYENAAWAYGHAQNGVITTLNATWQITGVQLEVGTVATPFEHRSYGEQLALCQRYYWQYGNEGSYTAYGSGVSESDTRARLCVDYPCTMRANPTFSVTNIGNTYIGRGNVTSVPTQLDDSYPGKNKALVDVGYGSAGSAGAGRVWFANSATVSSIQADAEL